MSTKPESDAERRVAQWRGVFNLLYRGSEQKSDAAFNITGWQSVYGRDPIPAEAMAEWLEQTVERVLALAPRRVLEIGCGTGLVLRRVAPRCDAYWGLDFSAESINLLRELESDRIRVLQRPGDQLEDLERGFFDTVVINSVIQYFPGAEYLERVIGGAIDLLAGQGTLFLGDIRHLGFLAPMQAEVALLQAAARARMEEGERGHVDAEKGPDRVPEERRRCPPTRSEAVEEGDRVRNEHQPARRGCQESIGDNTGARESEDRLATLRQERRRGDRQSDQWPFTPFPGAREEGGYRGQRELPGGALGQRDGTLVEVELRNEPEGREALEQRAGMDCL